MSIYQDIKGFGKKALLVGGLVAVLGACNQGSTWKLTGIVKTEQRGEGWYQVSLDKHKKNTIRYGKTLEVRFHSNNFDLDKIDEKINPGNKLTVVGTEVGGRDIGYEWKADAIDKIE